MTIATAKEAGRAVTRDALRRSLIHTPGGYAPTVSSNGAPKALYKEV